MRPLFVLVFLLGTTLQLVAQITDALRKRAEQFAEESRHRIYYVCTDRKLYAPGDKVWVQVYAIDSRTRKPDISREPVTLTLTTNNGDKLPLAATTLENGSGYVTVPMETSEGIYALELRDRDSAAPYKTGIGIRKKAVPAFVISMEMSDELLIPGEEATATIHFSALDAEPLKKVSFEFYLNDGTGEKLVHTGTSDGSSAYFLRFQVPRDLDEGMLGFGISANYRGATEILQGALRVATQQAYLRLKPEGGTLVAGIENHIAFQALDAYGNPFPFKGEVVRIGADSGIRLASSSGIGSFTLTPEPEAQYEVRIMEPYPIERGFPLQTATTGAMSIRLAGRRENALIISLKNGYGQPVKGTLAARNGDRIIWYAAYNDSGDAAFEIPMDTIEGFVDFVFIDGESQVLSRRVILWKPPDLIPVSLHMTTNTFQPRERVRVNVSTDGDRPFTQSFSAVLRPWSMAPSGARWIPLAEDPCMDTLTYLGLQYATSGERDLLMILSDAADIWGTGNTEYNRLPDHLVANRNFWLETQLLYPVEHYEGGTRYRNIEAGEYFLLGNAEYFRTLETRTAKRTESYKYMLESGTPVRDVVRKIKPYDLEGTSIVFAGRRNSLIAQDGAIIVVDGINTGTSATILDQIVPYDVEKIYVSTDPQDIQRYTGLNSVGLIEITMKRGPKPDKKSGTSTVSEAFTSPEYKAPGRMKGGRDFRNTLFWETSTTDDRIHEVNFYTGDLLGDMILSVFVMDAEGRIGYAELRCDIRL